MITNRSIILSCPTLYQSGQAASRHSKSSQISAAQRSTSSVLALCVSGTRRQDALPLALPEAVRLRKLHPDTCVHNRLCGGKSTWQTGFEHVCPKKDMAFPLPLHRLKQLTWPGLTPEGQMCSRPVGRRRGAGKGTALQIPHLLLRLPGLVMFRVLSARELCGQQTPTLLSLPLAGHGKSKLGLQTTATPSPAGHQDGDRY